MTLRQAMERRSREKTKKKEEKRKRKRRNLTREPIHFLDHHHFEGRFIRLFTIFVGVGSLTVEEEDKKEEASGEERRSSEGGWNGWC